MNNTDNTTSQTTPTQLLPENPPISVQGKNWRSRLPLIIGVLLTNIIVGTGGYLLGVKSNQTIIQNVPTEAPSIISPTVNPSQTTDLIPQENSLYFGTYQDKDALFITDKEKQKYFDPGAVPKTSPYIGELQMAGGGGYVPFDFKKLQNPKRILTNSVKPINSINSFIVNKDKTIVYVSVNYTKAGSQYPDLLNSILQINTNGSSANEIWSNDIGSNKYSKGGGATYLEQVVNDKYITFNIDNCYACSGSSVGTIVLNITTKSEKYYEMIGDLQLNLETSTLNYKKLTPFQEPCEPSPGCDNGQRTVMKPAGQTFTENLP